MVIDKSGMGLAIAEALEQEFWGEVEGITFTLPAVHAKKRMQEMKTRLPDTDVIRDSFRSVKKFTTATGQSRFDAEHDDKYGHADHSWAFAMAENASSLPTHGLFDLWKEQAEALAAGERPREPRTAEEEAKRQADAQMELGRRSSPHARRAFGEDLGSPTFRARVTLPAKAPLTQAYPNCGNKNLTRYGFIDMSSDRDESCNSCGWSRRTERK
jgi:hypothetical protein